MVSKLKYFVEKELEIDSDKAQLFADQFEFKNLKKRRLFFN